MALRNAGLFRVALAGLVALYLVGVHGSSGTGYLAIALAGALGVLLAVGRPKVLSREVLVMVLLDSLLITMLVWGTGGHNSPFFVLYFLVALELVWVSNVAGIIAGVTVVAGGYLAAVAVSSGDPGALLSPTVGLRAGVIALVCGAAALWGVEFRGVREDDRRLSAALADERAYGEEVASLVSKLGSVLSVLSPEEVLRWTVEAARESLRVPYAHVATFDGTSHHTAVQGDQDVYPSWWHPTIQRLVLWSCRTGEVHRSEEALHGIGGFLAVPLISADGESLGAVIAGGKDLGPEEERVLKLLAAQATAALRNLGEAPGGRDPVSGLPNRASLLHVLRKEVSHEKPFTLLMLELERFRSYRRTYGPAAVDALLRAIEGELGDKRRRMFGYEDDKFVAVLAGSDETTVLEKAARLRQTVEALTAGSTAPLRASVGITVTGPGVTNADLVLGAALSALGEGKGTAEGGVAVSPARNWGPDPEILRGVMVDARVREAVHALVRAIEYRAPHVGEHSRAVSNIARHLGAEMALPREQIDLLTIGALLHDVGKIGLPDSILSKPGVLTEEEREIVRRHPVLGAEIVEPVRGLSSVLPTIKHHHERFDGKGYPDGLRGEDIPFTARLVFVADALDSMVRDRPYRFRLSEEDALEEIVRNSGTQFDPDIVRALVEMVRESDSWRISSAG